MGESELEGAKVVKSVKPLRRLRRGPRRRGLCGPWRASGPWCAPSPSPSVPGPKWAHAPPSRRRNPPLAAKANWVSHARGKINFSYVWATFPFYARLQLHIESEVNTASNKGARPKIAPNSSIRDANRGGGPCSAAPTREYARVKWRWRPGHLYIRSTTSYLWI